MKRLTVATVTMVAAALVLGACGDDKDSAGPAVSAPVAAPTTTLPVIPAPSAAASDSADASLCRQVNAAGNIMKAQVIGAQQKNKTDFKPVKAALIEFAKKVDTARTGSDSAVAEAAKGLAAAATKGAAAADPMTAMESGDFATHFTALQQACAAAGVNLAA